MEMMEKRSLPTCREPQLESNLLVITSPYEVSQNRSRAGDYFETWIYAFSSLGSRLMSRGANQGPSFRFCVSRSRNLPVGPCQKGAIMTSVSEVKE